MGCELDKILWYIIIGLGAYFLLSWLTKIFAFYWRAGYEDRKKKRQARKEERRKWKYCKVTLDNPLLNQMRDDRTIIFMGEKGKGKSLLMSLVAHFLWAKNKEKDKKKKRYNRFMKPEYVAEIERLNNAKLLPIYSNLDFSDAETGYQNQELKPYFEMKKKAVEGAIFCIDEVSSTYGKDLYNSEDEYSKEEKKDIKENSKKNRHYTNGWILGTEQDGQDIYVGIRENGYALVHCLQTNKKLLKRGKCFRKIQNICNLILPGLFTCNLQKLFQEQLFVSGKIKLFCKLLLPSYFLLPVSYYTKRKAIYDKINRKYLRFETRFTYGTGEYWMRFSHQDIFAYNTRAFKKVYDKMFDKNGDRIYEKATAEA